MDHPHHHGNMKTHIRRKKPIGGIDKPELLIPDKEGDQHRHRRQEDGGDKPEVILAGRIPLFKVSKDQGKGGGYTQTKTYEGAKKHLKKGIPQILVHGRIAQNLLIGYQSGLEENRGGYRLSFSLKPRKKHIEDGKKIAYGYYPDYYRKNGFF
jgi:hypothetical protein